MEAQIKIADCYSVFMQEADSGINRVYQLHRELGGVFIDASFQEKDDPAQSVRHRIHVPQPMHVRSEVRWDEHSFPYEFETYEIGSDLHEVPLYRRPGAALSVFLENVVDVPPGGFEEFPEYIREGLVKITNAVAYIEDASFEAVNDFCLALRHCQAVNVALNESSLFDGGDLPRGHAAFLYSYIMDREEKYNDKWDEAVLTRESGFQDFESKFITRTINLLEKPPHFFKKGFISV